MGLALIYPWLKAAHVIFVIFWMAGLFMFPRYLVHHQEALGTPEADKWIDREAKLRRIILTPSMIVVWVAGLTLATLGPSGSPEFGTWWPYHWLHAKVLLVGLMTGYHGWMTAYAKRLVTGKATLTSKHLRLINELPALFVALIVILVVVKPF
jgi:putative membrane protein